MALPLRIRKVALSNLSPETNYAFHGFTPFLKPINYQDNISKEDTGASFHMPSISLVTNDPITQSYMYKLTESLNKHTLKDRKLRSSFIFLDRRTLAMRHYDPSRPL
jgi:hypothetical protein